VVESAAGSERILTLSEDAMRAAGLQVVVVSREAFHPHVVASGVIRPDAQKQVLVRARVAGRIVEVLADLGDSVRTGRPLARIEGPERRVVRWGGLSLPRLTVDLGPHRASRDRFGLRSRPSPRRGV
jgi:hypothetical protein